MNFHHYLLTSACAAALAVSAPALATDTGAGAKAGADFNVSASTDTAMAIEADALLGEDVENYEGEVVGDIESVILGEDGKVQAVVVGVGGFLGIGERSVALGWDQLDISDDGSMIRVDTTEEALKQLPPYQYSDKGLRGTSYVDEDYLRARMNDAKRTASTTFDKGVEASKEAYRDTSEVVGNAAEKGYDATKGAVTKGYEATKEAAADTYDAMRNAIAVDTLYDARGRLRASELIGAEIVSESGEVVGDIEDILISDGGNLELIVGAGGFLGIGEDRIALDWSDVTMTKNNGRVLLVTSAKAEAMKDMRYGDGMSAK